MTDARWQRVEELFHAALALPPAAREAFLDERCGSDASLAAQVRALLAQDAAGDTGLGGAVAASAAALARTFAPARGGERLGPWRIVSEIASGGMGAVFLAERADGQFEQRVAIKFLASGLFGPQAHHRFLAERQILAGLHHPYIAQLVDGGTSPAGTPYLVLEYVAGEPIHRWCDAHRLGVRARLALFLKACEAVQYAHQNLVIHRDIKPSNILVTADGVPKLLDFGIAKPIDARAPRHTIALTVADARLLTPMHASPEQVRGEPVSTATDVYALGVLLYELVSGRFPFELRDASLAEVERVICSATPERPSARIADHAGANRGTTRPKLARALAGDLDTIVLCALRKEPARRYATVRQLAEDIEHYLARRPIRARPDSLRYRARKFAARNRTALGAAGLALLLVVGTVAAYTWQLARERQRAELAAAKAGQVAGFLVDLFEQADTSKRPGRDPSVVELLDEGVRQVGQLDSQPGLQAELLGVMGAAYTSLGHTQVSIPLLRRALAVQQADPASRPLARADVLARLSAALRVAGQPAAAERTQREVLAIRERVLGGQHTLVARALNLQGNILHDLDRSEEALQVLHRALAIKQVLGEGADEEAASIHNNLAITLDNEGEFDAAAREYREAIAIHRRQIGPPTPALATSIYNLGLVLSRLGEYRGSLAAHREALALRREILGPDHWQTALSGIESAMVEARLGLFDDARAHAGHALAVFRAAFGEHSSRYATAARQMARLRLDLGDYPGAVAMARESVAALAGRRAEFPSVQAVDEAYLALALLRDGRMAAARAAIETAFDRRGGLNPRITPHVELTMAQVLSAQGERAQATALFETALAGFERIIAPGNEQLAWPNLEFARHLLAAGRPREALERARRAHELSHRALGERNWRTAEAAGVLGEALLATGDPVEARAVLARALAVLRDTFGPADPRVTRLARLARVG